MSAAVRKTAKLGELVEAVFDVAARYSGDPREVSRLATTAVKHILQRAPRTIVFPTSRATHRALRRSS